MLKCSVIGTGAAGNKAAIKAIEAGVIDIDKVTLLNTTLKDIPQQYRAIAVNFAANTDLLGGCGKERKKSKNLLVSAMKDGTIDLDSYVEEDDKFVVIVTSTSGGTGAGSAGILAKYYDEVMNLPVVIFAFTGFEDDLREKQNTVSFFKELDEGYTIHAISNKKFGYNSRTACEEAANDQFATSLRMMIGSDLIDSDQNIDDTDLRKVVTTPGYTIIEYAEVNDRIKNREQFNAYLIDMVDNSATLETPINNKMQRMALILNLNDKSMEFVDNTAKEVRDRLGTCFEEFIQRQYNGKQEFIAFICSGMNMPADEIENTYKSLLKEKEEALKNKESFFEKTFDDLEDDLFDLDQRTVKKGKADRDFFKSLEEKGVSTEPVPKKKEKMNAFFEDLNKEESIPINEISTPEFHGNDKRDKDYEFKNTEFKSNGRKISIDLS